MKKFLSVLLAVVIIALSFSSCSFNSNKKTAQKIWGLILSMEDTDKTPDYQMIYEEINDFLNSENRDGIISEYYGSVFESDSPEHAYSQIYSSYDALLLCLGKYDIFKTSVYENADMYSGKENYYFMGLWYDLVAISANSNNLNIPEIQKLFNEMNFEETQNQEYWNVFLYYWSLLWEYDVPEELKNEVLSLSDYNIERFYHTIILLLYNRIDDFNRLMVQECLNDPFTGTEYIIYLQDELLSAEQLTLLDEALEKVEEAYKEQRPNIYPLKKEIIDNIQKTIHQYQEKIEQTN